MITLSGQNEERQPGCLPSWDKFCLQELWVLSSADDVITEYIQVPLPLWGCASMREPSRVLMLEECKSFCSISSSMNNLRSQGWSNTVELDKEGSLRLVEVGNGQSLGCANLHCSLCHALLSHTCWRTLQLFQSKHRGKKCALHCVPPAGRTTADGPSCGTLHAFHSSLPTCCCSITFLCLWGAQGQVWFLSDHVTGHTWGCGHETSLQ